MGILDALKRVSTKSPKLSSLLSQFSGTRSKVNVDRAVALETTAMLCAARVIAEGVAQCPLKLYTETDDEEYNRTIRRPARTHPLYRILAYQPCWLTSFEFIEMMTILAAIDGNAYAWLNRAGGGKNGQVREMIPIAPDCCTPHTNGYQERFYKVRINGTVHTVPSWQIFHLRGPSIESDAALNIRGLCREAIGLSRAMENANSDHHSRGGRPSGVVSTASALSAEAVIGLRDAWNERFGPDGEGGTAILDNGASFTPITMSAVDAQLIENRKHQIEEIARAMRVFPIMLMQSDKASTFASAKEFRRMHAVHTLQPWIMRWEQALKRDVIGFDDDETWPRFSMEGLLRGDPEERASFYESMIDRGVMNRNEARVRENLNPRDGGDLYLSPLNMRLEGEGAPDDGDENSTV